METCENCEYNAGQKCIHPEMGSRPTVALNREHEEVPTPSCEHYKAIETKPVEQPSQDAPEALHGTIIAPAEDRETFDADISRALAQGYQPIVFQAVAVQDKLILVQTMVKVG